MKKIAINVLKYGASLSILAFLFWKASSDKSFEALSTQQKNWPLLGVGLGLCLAAITGTIVRWFLLVRALKLPFTLPEALRLGYIGFLFTFLPMGVVGGDAVKAYFLARRQGGKRTEAVASVVIDRIIGLYALFVLAAVAVIFTDLKSIQTDNIQVLRGIQITAWIAISAAVAGTIGLIIVALPTFGNTPLSQAAFRIPKVGNTIERVTTAIKMYRDKPALMLGIGVMSILIHCCFATSVYMIARGLPGDVPSFGSHFVIVPLAMLANTLPVGAFEVTMNVLYQGMSTAAGSQGFVIALGYRIATMFVAAIGLFFYLSRRQEVNELLEEAQEEEPHGRQVAEMSTA